jgi:FtsP/CotA-like multicopper oxidase with cupredoxin domain
MQQKQRRENMNNRRISKITPLMLTLCALPWGISTANAGPGGGTFYANSPQGTYNVGATPHVTGTALRKFVDRIPGLGLPNCTVSAIPGTGTCNENSLGEYIPIAQADTLTYPGSDYYVLGVKDYTQKMHTDLPKATKLRGYNQVNATDTKLQTPRYLGPLILATKDKPVRVLFQNLLGTGSAGNLFLPTDTTIMGAGTGSLGTTELHTQNRATLHLHGGHSPWISDGTPHQWITPPLDPTNYKKGLAFQNVPDMIGVGKSIPTPAANDGLGTFYWTNQQSGRLMFYHDHSYGITRLNVYAGEAAGYLITDPQEEAMITARNLPNICAGSQTTPSILCEYKYGIPLIIQDKSYVPSDIAVQDAQWNTATWGAPGDLYFPHVYEPNQSATGGLIPTGRWDYGPLVWPPSPALNASLPALSFVPESFMDTPVVNGAAYPYVDVQPKAYRFRMLNAANDRSWNLQLYYGSNAAGAVCSGTLTAAGTCTEVKMVPAIPRQACTALVTTNCACDPLAAPPATPAGCFPATWPTDGRDGGVPDPLYAGPQMVQIGTESGFLPAPVAIPNQPITFDAVGNVANKSLLLMPAERADVLIDFSAVAPGSTIILYNDAPAALPGGDPRYDYYTGNPDQTLSGGAPPTVAGFGPNTRTIMQFRVTAAAAVAPITTVNMTTLPAALSAAYTAIQPAHIVPAATYSKLTDVAMTVGGATVPFKGKSINEGFDPWYGRIFASFGTEAPNGLTPPVPLGYDTAPFTDATMGNNQVQLWKITHNGVDSHPIHFHLMDAQVVNRVSWSGEILPPEPSEMGWKETVRMNPMQDIIVAFRPIAPTVPFTMPDSIRQADVTMPVSALNPVMNFGWEYAWHCHILGHEEYDLMRPIIFKGTDRLGVFRGNGQWFLDANGNSTWDTTGDVVANFGATGDTPIRGDWTGDGVSKLGAYKGNGTWWLDLNGNGVLDAGETFTFGIAGDIPVVGDWTGNGISKIGVFRNGQWYLDMDGNGAWNAPADVVYLFGIPGDTPVTGDWNGNGKTKIGVFRNGQWYLNMTGNGAWTQPADVIYNFGIAGDIPVTGDWNADGKTKVGVFRGPGQWYLNLAGNGAWTPPTDIMYSFGVAGDKPITGKW